jgi:hypothetical protein
MHLSCRNIVTKLTPCVALCFLLKERVQRAVYEVTRQKNYMDGKITAYDMHSSPKSALILIGAVTWQCLVCLLNEVHDHVLFVQHTDNVAWGAAILTVRYSFRNCLDVRKTKSTRKNRTCSP